MSNRFLLVAFVPLFACTPAGTRPHDMSAAAHDEAAGSEDVAASAGAPGWTGGERDEAAMAEHRRLAAVHRAAAEALREAEASACVGVSDDDRDMSPFEHTADIVGVADLEEELHAGRSTVPHVVGATITIAAVRGLTAEWLRRSIACHLARNAALGHDVPEMPDCPLVPRGVTATVRSVGDAFAIDVHADTPEGVQEVLRRARSLHP